MAWVEALLRGQRVFARGLDDGSFVVEGGRVEVRYRANDGKAYRATAGNLERAPEGRVLPDETCGVAEPAERKKEQEPTAAGASPTAAKGPRWVAYTDGACTGNPGPAGAGFVVIEPDGKIHEAYEYLGVGTNNIAELTAILRALQAIPADAPWAVVHTDSKYSIGVLSKGWKAKANQELVAQTKAVLGQRKVQLTYVPGHSGVPMNERADQLAREAVQTRRSKGLGM
jgi:ribonuclease HI